MKPRGHAVSGDFFGVRTRPPSASVFDTHSTSSGAKPGSAAETPISYTTAYVRGMGTSTRPLTIRSCAWVERRRVRRQAEQGSLNLPRTQHCVVVRVLYFCRIALALFRVQSLIQRRITVRCDSRNALASTPPTLSRSGFRAWTSKLRHIRRRQRRQLFTVTHTPFPVHRPSLQRQQRLEKPLALLEEGDGDGGHGRVKSHACASATPQATHALVPAQ